MTNNNNLVWGKISRNVHDKTYFVIDTQVEDSLVGISYDKLLFKIDDFVVANICDQVHDRVCTDIFGGIK